MAKISIIMPVYNEEKNIKDCVDSILNQSMGEFELVIINDGSIDGTQDIVDSFISDNRVKVLKRSKIGKNAAFNDGFKHCTSDWICYFAGDDLMPQNSLKTRLEYLERYDGKIKSIAGFGQLQMISENKKYDGTIVPKNRNKGICTGTTLIMSRKLAEDVFPIPESYPNEDMWTKLVIDHFAAIKIDIPHIVAIYRIHEGNSLIRTDDFSIISENLHKRYLIYKEFYEKYNINLNEKSRIHLQSMIKAEDLRYGNESLKIVFIGKIGFKNKMRFLFHSSPFLYSIRHKLYKMFTGWN